MTSIVKAPTLESLAGAKDDSPGQRPGLTGVNVRKTCKGDTTDESHLILFRPFRAGRDFGTSYLGRYSRPSHAGFSGLWGNSILMKHSSLKEQHEIAIGKALLKTLGYAARFLSHGEDG